MSSPLKAGQIWTDRYKVPKFHVIIDVPSDGNKTVTVSVGPTPAGGKICKVTRQNYTPEGPYFLCEEAKWPE